MFNLEQVVRFCIKHVFAMLEERIEIWQHNVGFFKLGNVEKICTKILMLYFGFETFPQKKINLSFMFHEYICIYNP